MRRFLFSLLLAMMPGAASAACSMCATWNAPQPPLHIYGNTYYVGVHGLAAILITGPKGDILIDGDLDSSPPQIAGHIRQLGVRMGDIKLILNSHAHSDHAGGLAQLQRLSGAAVKASPWSAAILSKGGVAVDDPQHGTISPLAAVGHVTAIADSETVRVGPLALTAHFTPGHTPGGTSWTWQSCEKDACHSIAYVDSLTAVSAPAYKFSAHPAVIAQFKKSFQVVDALPCDILLTPHPEASDFYARIAAHKLVDPAACRTLVQGARANLQKRLQDEKK